MISDLQWDRSFALEQAGDDEALLAELLAILRQSAGDDLRRMKEAMHAGDGRALANAAHNIKGAAASLGMEKLRRVASELEQVGRSGEMAAAAAKLDTLEAMLGQLKAVK